jgi:bifunctional non-homologous end joining protein LigD
VIVLGGEALLLGVDGRSDFNGLHSRKHDHEVEFYAFDILVRDGEDLRRLPLSAKPVWRGCWRVASTAYS